MELRKESGCNGLRNGHATGPLHVSWVGAEGKAATVSITVKKQLPRAVASRAEGRGSIFSGPGCSQAAVGWRERVAQLRER